MKDNKKISIAGFISIFLIILSPYVLGATAQWFPTAGTTIDYKLSYIINWNNGTIQKTSRFDILNVSSPYIIPTILMQNDPEPIPFVKAVESGVEITLTKTYSEISSSSTQLNKSLVMKGNSSFFTEADGGLVTLIYAKMGATPVPAVFMDIESDTVDISNFWEGEFWGFQDYIDINLGIGGQIDNWHNVIAITEDEIIATDKGESNIYNYTYVAEKNGQVYFYQRAYSDSYTQAMEADSIAWVWERELNSNAIPSFSIGVILMMFSSLVAIFGFKIRNQQK